MYKKLLFTFVAIITSLILALSSLLYYNYNSSFINTVKGMNENLLSNISYSSVYMDNISQKFCQSLLVNRTIMAFAYSNGSKDEDILNISSAIRTLRELTIPNSYIHSAYIYNRKIDTIIDTNTFYDSDDFYDQEIVRILDTVRKEKSPSLYPFPRKVAMPAGSDKNFANVYTYILFDNFDYKGNYDSAIVLNVDAEWLRLTIASLNKAKNGNDIIVVDDGGDIVSNSSPDQFLRNVSNEPYLHDVLTAAAPSGTYVERLDGKKHVITYVSSDILKWKFISLMPYDTAFSVAKKNGLITLIFCLIILLLGLLFAVLASKKLYRPLGTLTRGIIQRLGPESAPSKNMDELGYLSTAFTGMLDKTQVLENMKRNATPVIKNEFMKNVVTGRVELPTDIMITKRQELGIDLDFRNPLYLFILKIDYYKDFVDRHSEKDRSLYQYAIANIAREITGERFKNEVVETAHDQFTVLADIGDTSEQPSQLTEIFRDIVGKIQSSVQELLNLSLTGTLSSVIDSPDRIKNAYDNAFNLSMYRIKTGHNSIITPETLKEVETGSFIFPLSKEKQLIDSLKLGSGEAAKENFREIIKAIEHSSYDNIITSVIYLFFSIFNSLNRIAEGSESKFNSISINFFNKVSGFETFEEIELTFFEMFDDIIRLKDSAKDRKKNDIVNTAIDHIHADFADKNLSLNSCAESLSLSSVYLGKLFKKSTGKSVAEYITMVRMEKIKELLEQNRLPMNEILERCGVEKSNYFYTSFKKYFGVSLSEYRLNNVKVSGEREE
ncbi:helix-turn-helix domain-containing protein [Cohnella endophytica]|uniref:Helix-turn-helix domain-containing protein n=1 Tax=Cohnella endophytica TaxID=2419778 RepID=A0A494XUV8_9BACL|nr:helix-turn-helix domain-containing protein [Cohnella endophytica]RKP54401.1 helix-turn-helix domain-containing protein [Cohnella endophytica]